MKRRTLLSAASAGVAVLGAPMLRAQTLPTGTIRVIVGFPPGGGTDALARTLFPYTTLFRDRKSVV